MVPGKADPDRVVAGRPGHRDIRRTGLRCPDGHRSDDSRGAFRTPCQRATAVCLSRAGGPHALGLKARGARHDPVETDRCRSPAVARTARAGVRLSRSELSPESSSRSVRRWHRAAMLGPAKSARGDVVGQHREVIRYDPVVHFIRSGTIRHRDRLWSRSLFGIRDFWQGFR